MPGTMAISDELRAQFLRYHFVEHWRVGTIASQLRVHHYTVDPVLSEAGVQRERQRRRRASKLDPYVWFIILPWFRIRNLASHLLAQLQRRLPHEGERRYALRPVLLETLCESVRFLGTCYQSANWLCVGHTQGRGKLDVHRQSALPVKSVWLKPLQRDWERSSAARQPLTGSSPRPQAHGKPRCHATNERLPRRLDADRLGNT